MKKTIQFYIIVFVTFILGNATYAQYNGGIGNGSAINQLSQTSCSVPAHFFAYFGGSSDSATFDLLTNTSCSAPPPSFFAYMGGSNDASGFDLLTNTSCSAPPPSFFAYMGGSEDSAATDQLQSLTCGIPPSFYAYFGGPGDGATMDMIGSCPVTPPVTSFTASTTTLCTGSTVTFTDNSTNIPFIWHWTFAGGTPATSTAQNPTVQYNTAGVYQVSLTAQNYNGSNTHTETAYITVTAIPAVLTTTPGSRCDSGVVTLQATSNLGTLNWYDAATGGTLLGTGASFITPSISATANYYVEAASGSCSSLRTSVTATVNTTPSVVTTAPASRCGTGSVTLQASASAGTLSWYNIPTGGSVLGTGTSFVTPSIGATTTFYVSASQNSCASPRTAVIATVNTVPSITSTTSGSRCDSGTVTLSATASNGTLNWYGQASGGSILGSGTSFITPTISATTTYYVEATDGTCTSPRIAVTATASVSPAVTSVSGAGRCDSGTVTLGAAASAGTLNWYDVAIGGTSLATGSTFTTPSISSTTTYYVEAVNGSCVSARSAVIATVTLTPTILSSTSASRCGNGSVTLGANPSAGTINWYNAPLGGTLVASGSSFTTPSLGATTTYYAEAINGSCISPRTAVVATINVMPTVTSAASGSRCDTGSVTLQASASSGVLRWYNVSTGGAILGTGPFFPTPSISATTIFYVEAFDGGCTSDRTAVTATVNETPTIVSTSPASRCGTGTVTISASASSGTLSWFNVSTGGTAIATGTSFTTLPISATTTYYVQAANGSCTSARTAVVATVNVNPTITATTAGSRCDAGTVTLGATASAGTINWYANPSGGSVLGTGTSFITPAISSTTTYYAEASNASCISARTAVVATVNSTPSITSTTPSGNCGTGSVTLGATANVGTISWYANATGGSVLGTGNTFTTPSITATTVYYAEASNSSCVSVRTAVTATINVMPTVDSSTPASRCGSGSLTLSATASSGIIHWYNAAFGGIEVGSGNTFVTPSLTTTTTYYAQAVNGSCSSDRTAVEATINLTPMITSTTPASRCDNGGVTLGATGNGTLNWYAAAVGGSSLASGETFNTGNLSATTTFYVQASNLDCTSPRTAVVATVNVTPTIVSTTPGNRCGTGTVVLSAAVSGGTISWYNVSSGGTAVATGALFTTPSISATTTYYVEVSNGSCVSTRVSVVATVNAAPTITATTPASRCGTGTVTLSATAASGTFNWYDVAVGGTAIGTGASFVTPTISATTTFYVEVNNGNCTSVRVPVIATVTVDPVVVSTVGGTRCGSGTVVLSASASAGTLNWYNVGSGGSVLGTGTSFTTPSISSTSIFYVEAVNGSCVSPRIAVTATVNTAAAIVTAVSGSRCGTGTVTLSATGTGTLNWYSSAVGGTVLGTGTTFETPSISATTTFYVESTSGDCISDRTAVTAAVNVVPVILTSTPGSRCGTGTVFLAATSSGGTLNWYNVPSGGIILGSGTSFETASISATTTYYVEAVNGSCISDRTAVIATVNAVPTIINTTPGSRCDTGSVTLNATADSGTLNWYAVSTGGTILGSGATFATPNISASTTFYVEAAGSNCSSARVAVLATVNTTPAITSATPAARCDAGSVTLGASSSAGNLSWYAVASGGSVLGSGTVFVTPSISATTTYYVEASNGSCTSARIAVLATVNATPQITATVPGSRCGTGTVTLQATAIGTISWFANQTGGTALATGSVFITPSISATTTYYAEVSNGSCTSVRTAVEATVNTTPQITSTTPASRCGTGSVTLEANAASGTVSWFASATGGTALATGSAFNTPSISTNTTYYAEVSNGSCTSARVAVLATVNITAAPTGSSAQTFCTGETVGMLITVGTDVEWYDAANGGNLIDDNTPLVDGTTYYASQNLGSCDSDTRLAVTATLGNCLNVREVEKPELKLYPNPVTDWLNISYSANISRIEIVNMLGQVVYNRPVNAGETKIDMSSLAGGTYLVRVTADDLNETYKVIKK